MYVLPLFSTPKTLSAIFVNSCMEFLPPLHQIALDNEHSMFAAFMKIPLDNEHSMFAAFMKILLDNEHQGCFHVRSKKFSCEKKAKIDFSNIKCWVPYSWGTHLCMYSLYSQPLKLFSQYLLTPVWNSYLPFICKVFKP
jgi:hypothetical protein